MRSDSPYPADAQRVIGYPEFSSEAWHRRGINVAGKMQDARYILHLVSCTKSKRPTDKLLSRQCVFCQIGHKQRGQLDLVVSLLKQKCSL